MDLNFEIHQESADDFHGVYAYASLNWFLFAIYLLGYGSCAALAIVSWFELSGQAGPFRTLVNQLVSQNLFQVCCKSLQIIRKT